MARDLCMSLVQTSALRKANSEVRPCCPEPCPTEYQVYPKMKCHKLFRPCSSALPLSSWTFGTFFAASSELGLFLLPCASLRGVRPWCQTSNLPGVGDYSQTLPPPKLRNHCCFGPCSNICSPASYADLCLIQPKLWHLYWLINVFLILVIAGRSQVTALPWTGRTSCPSHSEYSNQSLGIFIHRLI